MSHGTSKTNWTFTYQLSCSSLVLRFQGPHCRKGDRDFHLQFSPRILRTPENKMKSISIKTFLTNII
jgi:hypothetical protein